MLSQPQQLPAPTNPVPALKSKHRDAALPAILEYQSPSVAIVQAPTPLSARLIIWSLGTLLLSCIAAMGVIPVDRVVTAQGKVVSEAHNIVVQPLETSIVREINVHEGQMVAAGDIIAKLDPTFANADASALQEQVKSLSAEVDRLQAEARKEPFVYVGSDPILAIQASLYAQRQTEYNSKVENYTQKIRSLYNSVQKAEGDRSSYQQRLVVAESVESMRSELERNQVGSKLNTLSAKDNRIEVQRGMDNAFQTIASAKSDLAALASEQRNFEDSWRAEVLQKLAEQSRTLNDAKENLRKATLRKQLVELRATKDATVLTVAKVSVGSVMQSGDPLVTMVPLDAPLEIEANVSGKDNGFVHQGDPVTIKFDTFPYTLYGKAAGTVRIVSADSFTSADEQRSKTPSAVPVPANSVEPFYHTRVSIDQVNLHGVPASFKVMPGMPVTADIKVGERTVLMYMLGKVLPVVNEGMREP